MYTKKQISNDNDVQMCDEGFDQMQTLKQHLISGHKPEICSFYKEPSKNNYKSPKHWMKFWQNMWMKIIENLAARLLPNMVSLI